MSNRQIWAEDPIFNQIQLSYLKWLRFISYISNELSVSPLQLQCLKVPRCPRTRRKLRKQLVTGSTRRFPFLISLEEYRLNIAAWLNNPQLLFMKIQGMRQARNLAPLSPDCLFLTAVCAWIRKVSQTLKNGFNSAANAVTKLHCSGFEFPSSDLAPATASGGRQGR